tara:strand:+ start:440 stop:1321 length:882 start_codon:yes stop_codon:yes gene_type:complete
MSLAAAYMFGRKQGVVLQKLLDQFPNAAAAFSVKKIRNAYSGNCMKVRRASDNTTLDIGFSGDDLDTSSLQTFCAGTDGFIDTWYDQSGNAKNATQSGSGNQPKIVTSGSVILKDGIPAISSDGVNDNMLILGCESVFDPAFSAFGTFAYKVKAAEQRLYSYNNNASVGTTNAFYTLIKLNPNLSFVAIQGNPFTGLSALVPNSQDLQRIVTSHVVVENSNINGKTDTSSIVLTAINNLSGISGEGYKFRLFSNRNGNGSNSEMLSQQFVFYDADKTANIQSIEDNITTTFNI